MPSINVPESESVKYESFVAGEPVELNAIASEFSTHEFNEGNPVSIIHLNMEASGIILEKPSVVADNSGKTVLKVRVRKV